MERENFNSRLGMLLAMVGSAVGLGNIWRFPYLVGEYGGAAFIILYIVFVFLLSMPILLSEFIIGRFSRLNAYGAYDKVAPNTLWRYVGFLSVLSPFLIIAYYDVVGGWSMHYFFQACSFSFTSMCDNDIATMFSRYISSPFAPLFGMGLFLAMTCLVVQFGVQSGIEKFGKIMMPLLFFVIIGIVIWVMTLPGASEGVKYLFKPDFSKVTGKTLVAAMGQAFFSLSLGCGTMLTYASYAKKSDNILKSSLQIAFADLLFAVLASCMILPGVFAFGVDPGEGPGLIFQTLPMMFASMPMGSIVAIFFFLAVLIAALTSTISMLEVTIAYLVEEHKMSRKLASSSCFAVLLVLGVLCSLSFGPLSNFKIFGFVIFDAFDGLAANILMPFGGILACLFVGWKMKKPDVFAELTNEGSLRFVSKIYPLIYFFIRIVAPVGILVVTVSNWLL